MPDEELTTLEPIQFAYDHVWRPFNVGGKGTTTTKALGECAYMNCRLPPDQHIRRRGKESLP